MARDEDILFIIVVEAARRGRGRRAATSCGFLDSLVDRAHDAAYLILSTLAGAQTCGARCFGGARMGVSYP